MFSELKVLFIISRTSDPSILREIFRKYFSLPSQIVFCDIEKTDCQIGKVYDLTICDFTSQMPDSPDFINNLASKNSSGCLLVFSSVGAMSGVPPGVKAMLYTADSESILRLLPAILPGLGTWVEYSIKHDIMALDRQLSDHVLNNSRSMLSVINRDYVYERVNDRFSSNQGKDSGHFVGKSLSEVWGETNFTNNIRPRLDECFMGKTVRYEAAFETPTSGHRSFDVIFRPFYSVSGTVTHLLAESFDVTEIRDAEAAFSKINEQLSRLEDNIPVGYLRCRLNGDIVHINNACLDIFSLDKKVDITSLNIRDFYSDSTLFGIHVDHLMANSSKKLGRVFLHTSDNEDRVCSMTGFINHSEGEDNKYIDFAIEDITREIFLEGRLMQAQRLETVGALAGGIAHDFNNILTTVYGYAEMSIEDLEKNSPVSENMARIILAVNKARSLTNQILTFSRQIEQEKVQVNLWQVLFETISFVTSAMPQKISVRDNSSDSGIKVLADPTQLFRVFLNLLTNSIQAMEKSGGTLVIDTNICSGEGLKEFLHLDILADDYVMISITDTGIGMDDSLLDRIFEPFFTTREIGKGTGLGLSVVHGIVTEMGGDISVKSELGKGTTFRVYLPVYEGGEVMPETVGKKPGLLFISGNRFESRILSIALENAGYSVSPADNGKDILNIMSKKNYRPDMMIFHDDLPDFSFYDLLSVMKKVKHTVPLILITESQDLILKESLLISGFVKHFLIKPVSLREVKTAIEISLTSNQQPEPRPAKPGEFTTEGSKPVTCNQ